MCTALLPPGDDPITVNKYIISYYIIYHIISYQLNQSIVFNVHVTVHRNKFFCNKTNYMHGFHKFILSWNSICFGQFLCPSSGIYLLYTQQWYMLYMLVDSFRSGPEWSLVLLESCLQSCMTYTIAECTVNKLLMVYRRTVRNM